MKDARLELTVSTRYVIQSSSKDLEGHGKQVMINLCRKPIFKLVFLPDFSKINLALRNFNNLMLYSEFCILYFGCGFAALWYLS